MWHYPKIVAHRGGGILAPENTLAAMRCGVDHGFHAVEFDVMLSRDGLPLLMHDPLFGRTVQGTGSVAEHTLAELLRMDAGAWFDTRFAGETVPSFEDVITFCRANRIWMNVEIKPVPGFEAATGTAVAQVVQRRFADLDTDPSFDPAALPLLSSFSVVALAAAQATAPDIPRGLLADRLPPDWHAQCAALGAVSMHLNQRFMTPEVAAEVKARGNGLFCYTVNEPARARQLLEWGVDGFCTDRIDLIGPDFPAADAGT